METTFAKERAVIGKKFGVGEKVTCNGGFPGVVIRYYSTAMVEVRLDSGLVCVPECDVRKL